MTRTAVKKVSYGILRRSQQIIPPILVSYAQKVSLGGSNGTPESAPAHRIHCCMLLTAYPVASSCHRSAFLRQSDVAVVKKK